MTKRSVIITSIILVAILGVFTILFGVVFRVRDIKYKYGEDFKYKEQISEIKQASKLKKNASIFNLDHKEIKNNIEHSFPYARAQVNLDSMFSVKITLTNREPMYYFVQESVYYILDEDCKILEITTAAEDANKYIELKNVFNADENTSAGEFLVNDYSSTCKNLYYALYSNAQLDKNADGELDEGDYLNREDMLELVSSLQFVSVEDLYGEVDKLIVNTSLGTLKLTIIEPSNNLDYKINVAFSALRALINEDEENSTNFSTCGVIEVKYKYVGGERKLACEYHENA